MKNLLRIYKLICLRLIFGACLGLSACSDTPSKTYVIGFSQCNMVDSWRKNMVESMEREVSFYPEMSFMLKDANGDNEKQIQQIQGFIDNKVDLLIASPFESAALTPIIEKAYKAEIPVILIDRRIESDNFTTFIGADNYQVGQNAAIYANTFLKGHGAILEMGVSPNAYPSIGRHTGFEDIIEKFPDIKLYETLWTAEKRLDTLTAILKRYPNIDLIFAHTDRLAYDAFQVCETLKRSKKIKIIGVDGLAGDNEGLDLVNKGKINATILYPTGGEEAIKIAVKILKKQPFDKENSLFSTVINRDNVGMMLAQLKKLKAQQNDIDRQALKIKDLDKTYSTQRNRLYFISILLLCVVLSGAILFYLFKEKQVSNRILSEQNQAILIQKNEILAQKNEIEKVSLIAQQATEEKLRFYAYISHEFKTPLSLILTPTEDMLNRKAYDTKDTRFTFQFIYKNANRLLRLVDQFLELRKIDMGKMVLEVQQNDIVAFTKDIVSDFTLKAKSKNIDLQFVCPFETLPFWFDSEKLDKVLFNIISNAFKYTPQNGLIHIMLLRSGDNIEIIIADSGAGMTVEEKEHAFDLFYRGNQKATLSSGLGLALSQEFVHLHQGNIILTSEKDKGTTFKITLPFVEWESPTLSQTGTMMPHFNHIVEIDNKPEAPPQYLSNTLVLIEDNPDLSQFLTHKLGKNYHIVRTETAENGLELILEHIPDVIISDVMLPNMSGFALTQKVKNDFRTSHIPVILLTAKGQVENQIEGTKAGADIYIAKPFNQQLLEENIRTLIDNRDKMRRRFSNEITNTNQVPKGERKFLLEFETIIEKHIKDGDLSLEKISHEMGISRVQLFRKISALTGKSVLDYITEFKVQKAKTLLKDTNKTIAEIAYELGFNTPSYFTTFFKQKTHQTPRDWRNS
jgi:signal transduction histidine kinase/DNA-binding response OmpR family regulator